MLFYYWHTLPQSWVIKLIFLCQVGFNTIFFVGDVGFAIYTVYCKIVGKDPNYYLNKIKQQTKKFKKMSNSQQYAAGYSHVPQDIGNTGNDDENRVNDSDSEDNTDAKENANANANANENENENENENDNDNDNGVELGSNFLDSKNKKKFKSKNVKKKQHKKNDNETAEYRKQQ